MLQPRNKWRLLSPSDQQIDELVEQLKIEPLSARLLLAAKESMGFVTMVPNSIIVHSVCRLSDLTVEVLQEYAKNSNESQGEGDLRLLLIGVELLEYRKLGENQQHIKLTIQQDDVLMDCIGYNVGGIVREITPHSIANVVVEPAIREWNGVYKVQLILLDMEITEMQIFDFRETKNRLQRVKEIENRDSLIVCFREESKQELLTGDDSGIAFLDETLHYTYIRGEDLMYTQIILYDTPYSMEQFRAGLRLVPKPERIYCLFGEDYTDRLAVIPSREQFKWLYGLIHTRKQLTQIQIPLLSKARNLSDQTVEFMLQVFVELGFIIKREEVYRIIENPTSKALTESRTYQRKKKEMDLETEILYSSYGILCKIIKEVTL